MMAEKSVLQRWADVIAQTPSRPRPAEPKEFGGWQIVSIHRDPCSDQVFSTEKAARNYLLSDPEVAELGPVERDRLFRIERRSFRRVS